jgi:DnaD/phage-associated family protein
MFKGFSDNETFTRLPDSFFHHLLKEIEDVDELKVTFHVLWHMEHMEGNRRYLREADLQDLLPDPKSGLDKAVQRGTLIRVQTPEPLYFLNSPRGRTAAAAYERGEWQPGQEPAPVPQERPNIYKLYEENIGPLTPMIADALREAEQEHPPEKVAEALEIAVKNNKRSWKYAEAILRRWKEEGYAKEQDRRNVETDRRREARRKIEDLFKK